MKGFKIFKCKALAVTVMLFSSSLMVNAAKYDSFEGGDVIGTESYRDYSKFFFKKNNTYPEIVRLIKIQNFSEAHFQIVEKLKKAPNDSLLFDLQAMLYTVQGNKQAAVDSYQLALGKNSEDKMAYVGLATFALENKKFQKAEEYLLKALVIDENYFNAYLIQIEINLQQGKRELAKENALKEGLKNLWKEKYGSSITRAKLNSRVVIELENPFVTYKGLNYLKYISEFEQDIFRVF